MRFGRRWHIAIVVLVAVIGPWAGSAAAQEPGTSHSEMPNRDERKPEQERPDDRPAQERPDEKHDDRPAQETPVEEHHRRPAVIEAPPERDAPVDQPRLGRAPTGMLPVTGGDLSVLTMIGVSLIAIGWLLASRRHRSS